MANTDHLLDILIREYYRVQELNNRVPILIEYKIEPKHGFFELTLKINRSKNIGLYCFSSVDACKDAVVESFFLQGIELYNTNNNGKDNH